MPRQPRSAQGGRRGARCCTRAICGICSRSSAASERCCRSRISRRSRRSRARSSRATRTRAHSARARSFAVADDARRDDERPPLRRAVRWTTAREEIVAQSREAVRPGRRRGIPGGGSSVLRGGASRALARRLTETDTPRARPVTRVSRACDAVESPPATCVTKPSKRIGAWPRTRPLASRPERLPVPADDLAATHDEEGGCFGAGGVARVLGTLAEDERRRCAVARDRDRNDLAAHGSESLKATASLCEVSGTSIPGWMTRAFSAKRRAARSLSFAFNAALHARTTSRGLPARRRPCSDDRPQPGECEREHQPRITPSI